MFLSISFDPLFREANRAKQHLTLDLLDLASFSSPAIRAATPKDQMPFKAVYKDAVMGIRYLFLEREGGGTAFKRLRVKFTSVEERKRFVEAVGAFVPSKPAVEPVKAKSTPAKKGGGGRGAGQKSTITTPKKGKKQQQLDLSSATLPPLPTDSTVLPSSSIAVQVPSTSPQKKAATPARDHALPFSAQPAPQPSASTSARHVPSDTHSILPRNLTSLLPNLSSATQALPLPLVSTLTPSELLNQLPPVELETLMEEVLLEEGFEELVRRVQEMVRG
jgi:hypothetical protein